MRLLQPCSPFPRIGGVLVSPRRPTIGKPATRKPSPQRAAHRRMVVSMPNLQDIAIPELPPRNASLRDDIPGGRGRGSSPGEGLSSPRGCGLSSRRSWKDARARFRDGDRPFFYKHCICDVCVVSVWENMFIVANCSASALPATRSHCKRLCSVLSTRVCMSVCAKHVSCISVQWDAVTFRPPVSARSSLVVGVRRAPTPPRGAEVRGVETDVFVLGPCSM